MGMAGKGYAAVLGLVVLLNSMTGCGYETRRTVVFEKAATTPTRVTETNLALPFVLPDSGLVAEKLISYDGSYWEDGSGEQVQDVSALMLYNPGERMVEFAAVAIRQDDRQQYFFVYRLPPKSRCLVLEKGRTHYEEGGITACRELSVRWEYQELSRERLSYIGFGEKLTVTNREKRLQEHITLWYKRYVEQGDYYLGGEAYSEHLFFLQSQEERVVMPENYDAANTRVVSIRIEE